jgi:hypothetical protein
MTTRPTAALALWNDVERERDLEYERWHAIEHVPERVWVPGFLAATRYLNLFDAGPRYFTLYELDTLDALGTPEYRDLVVSPTPWSASMRTAMSHFIRKPLVLSLLDGNRRRGEQGGIVTLRAVWDTIPTDWGRHTADLAIQLRAAGPDATRVAGGWVAEAGPQALANVHDAPAGAEAILWVELEGEVDRGRLQAHRSLLQKKFEEHLPKPLWQHSTCYSAITQVVRAHPPGSPRPPPRLDLMAHHLGENT